MAGTVLSRGPEQGLHESAGAAAPYDRQVGPRRLANQHLGCVTLPDPVRDLDRLRAAGDVRDGIADYLGGAAAPGAPWTKGLAGGGLTPLPGRPPLLQAEGECQQEVIAMADRARTAARAAWLGRLGRLGRLLLGPNKLRRPSDRLEGLIVTFLSAALAAAVAAAPWFAGHLYLNQRADAARLRAATAVLTQSGPSGSYLTTAGEAAARWQAPDGQRRTGILTTTTAPGISGARAGDTVRVWLTGSGQPQDPPMSAAEAMFSSVVLAAGAVFGAAIAMLICYVLCRLALDRQRLAAWASEWSQIGPRWTTRR
jgi:hypothetical protein